jgi:hypothetical protein
MRSNFNKTVCKKVLSTPGSGEAFNSKRVATRKGSGNQNHLGGFDETN